MTLNRTTSRTLHAPPQGMSARHTLGSDPDSADVPLRGKSEHPNVAVAVRDLPRPVWWLAAVDRARHLNDDGARSPLVQRLISHVELGWPLICALQAVCSRYRKGALPEALREVLRFADHEVIGLFFRLALRASELVACGDYRPDAVTLHHTQEESERLARYLVVLTLATAHPAMPEPERTEVLTLLRDLSDWLPDYDAVAGAIHNSPP